MKVFILSCALVLGLVGITKATDCHQQFVQVQPIQQVVQYQYVAPVIAPVVAVPHVNYQTILQVTDYAPVQLVERVVAEKVVVQKVRNQPVKTIVNNLKNRRQAVRAVQNHAQPVQKVIVRERNLY